jgi:hypothetical protein
MTRHNPHGYDFIKKRTPDIQALLASQITDLSTLRERLAGSTLVAFDTEGVTQNFEGRQIANEEIGELGIAVLQPTSNSPRFVHHILQFYEINEIEVFTIRIHERPYGRIVGTVTDETTERAGARLFERLSEIAGERILLGWGMQREMKWISEKCPSMARLFTSWCDVQELVAASYESNMLDTGKLIQPYQRPGLDKTMRAQRISGWRSHHQRHGAAADAVRTLAILSGLLCGATLQEHPNPKSGVSVLCTLPSLRDTKICGRQHYYTARIRVADGDKLPLQTPYGLEKLYARHWGLMGEGLNSRTEVLARDRVKIWWVSFRSQETLNGFIARVDGSTFDGKVLRVTATKPVPILKTNWEPVIRPEPVDVHNDLCLAFDIFSTTGESEEEQQPQQSIPTMAA